MIGETAAAPRGRLVAVVDSGAEQRAALSKALAVGFRVVEYPSTSHALAGIAIGKPDVVVLDEHAAPLGPRLIGSLRQDPETALTPVVLLLGSGSAVSPEAAARFGAVRCLTKPFRRSELLAAVARLVAGMVEAGWSALPEAPRAALRETSGAFREATQALRSGGTVSYAVIDRACAPVVDAVGRGQFMAILQGVREHDDYSYSHSVRVATLLAMLGEVVGLSKTDLAMLASGGLLHDVGKARIPLEVLNKPGRLTDAEWQVMRSHVAASVDFLRASEGVPKPILDMAGRHHEKLDGSGYPGGLSGAQLNELTRMISIVDVFGALTDERVYKAGMSAEKALDIMATEMTGHLDTRLVRLFRERLLDAARSVRAAQAEPAP